MSYGSGFGGGYGRGFPDFAISGNQNQNRQPGERLPTPGNSTQGLTGPQWPGVGTSGFINSPQFGQRTTEQYNGPQPTTSADTGGFSNASGRTHSTSWNLADMASFAQQNDYDAGHNNNLLVGNTPMNDLYRGMAGGNPQAGIGAISSYLTETGADPGIIKSVNDQLAGMFGIPLGSQNQGTVPQGGSATSGSTSGSTAGGSGSNVGGTTSGGKTGTNTGDGNAAAMAQKSREDVLRLTEGFGADVLNDPYVAAVLAKLQGNMDGGGPYTQEVQNWMINQQADMSAAAQSANAQRMADMAGASGMSLTSPAYAAKQQEMAEQRQLQNMNSAQNIGMQSHLANYQAQNQAAKDLASTRLGQTGQVGALYSDAANFLTRDIFQEGTGPSTGPSPEPVPADQVTVSSNTFADNVNIPAPADTPSLAITSTTKKGGAPKSNPYSSSGPSIDKVGVSSDTGFNGQTAPVKTFADYATGGKRHATVNFVNGGGSQVVFQANGRNYNIPANGNITAATFGGDPELAAIATIAQQVARGDITEQQARMLMGHDSGGANGLGFQPPKDAVNLGGGRWKVAGKVFTNEQMQRMFNPEAIALRQAIDDKYTARRNASQQQANQNQMSAGTKAQYGF